MTREEFKEFCRNTIIIQDGASGTMMQSRGMPSGVCPELFAVAHPEILIALQREYCEAGANIIYTFTLGGNSAKLSQYGLGEEEAYSINRILAEVSCAVRDDCADGNENKPCLVAGDISSTGKFLQPVGDMSSSELKRIFSQQAQALKDGGVDLFVVETMMDLAETKIALLGIREVSDLPVIVTMTFENQRTLAGNSPLECLLTLEDAGADAFGANCSTGPDEMRSLLNGLREITDLPLVAKPNAGMPTLIDGKTIFPMEPAPFAERCEEMVRQGIRIVGGCCGTTPEHIRSVVEQLTDPVFISTISNENLSTTVPDKANKHMVCSSRRSISLADPLTVVTIRYTDPDNVAYDVMDACEDDPDLVVIDLTGCEDKPYFNSKSFTDAIATIGMTQFTPLGILNSSSGLSNALREAYCGKLACLSDGEYNKLFNR